MFDARGGELLDVQQALPLLPGCDRIGERIGKRLSIKDVVVASRDGFVRADVLHDTNALRSAAEMTSPTLFDSRAHFESYA